MRVEGSGMVGPPMSANDPTVILVHSVMLSELELDQSLVYQYK